MFHVGQKVVCVNASNTALVKVGNIYVVEGMYEQYLVLIGVGFDIKNDKPFGGRGMYKERFRPLVETKLDVFNAILKSVKSPELV